MKQKGEVEEERLSGVPFLSGATRISHQVCLFNRFMMIICWTFRGVGEKGKDGAIRNLVAGKDASFGELVKTKHTTISEAKIRKWWGQVDVK